MRQYGTAFLLKAVGVAAVCCWPMALDREGGYVWTAFLLPVSLAWLAMTQVEQDGPVEVALQPTSNAEVEIVVRGGRYAQWVTRMRMAIVGGCLSVAIGFPALHTIDPEPIEYWLPLVGAFAVGGVAAGGCSLRQRVLIDRREFVTDYLLFGQLRWWRRRWRVRAGDVLAVSSSGQAQYTGVPELAYRHAMSVCRGRRGRMIAAVFSAEAVAPEVEAAARRLAELVGVPCEGGAGEGAVLGR